VWVSVVAEVVAQVRFVQVVYAPVEASYQLAISVTFYQPKIIDSNPIFRPTDFAGSGHLSFSPLHLD